SSTIYPGQKIVVPLTRAGGRKLASRHSANGSPEKRQPAAQEKRKRKERKKKPSKAKVRYKVRRGDTIGHIAEWFDVSSSQVRQWNNTSNSIRPGEYLILYVPRSKEPYYKALSEMPRSQKQRIEQKKRSGKDVVAAYLAMNSGSRGEYTVQPNDTLIEIAKAHGISVSKIKRLNGIYGSQIYVGQTVSVSGTGSK